MEEGVVSELFRSPMRNIYDNRFLITDVSGSGNNWAVGHFVYGNRYHEELSDVIRKAAELCECLQCFFLIHSLGGGTGSGVGTHLLQILADEYPDVYRIVTAVFPSTSDDVITSPYNTVLACHRLTDLADCVLAVDNSSLANLISRMPTHNAHSRWSEQIQRRSGTNLVSTPVNWKDSLQDVTNSGSTASSRKAKAFDAMNNIVASMLLNLTRVDQLFSDVFTRDYQLMSVDPCRHTYLAAALLVRGSVCASDIRKNIERLQQRLRFVPWNREGWKVGHCLVPPVGSAYSLLALSNNTVIRERFVDIFDSFMKLYKRKAHVHHYTCVDGFEAEQFKTSADSLEDLYHEYEHFERQTDEDTLAQLPRLHISH